VLTIVVVLLLTVLVGAAVLAYVAFPHRGEDLPVLPQAGRAVRKGVNALPVLDEVAAEGDAESRLPSGR
jgi:hypothetical protein